MARRGRARDPPARAARRVAARRAAALLSVRPAGGAPPRLRRRGERDRAREDDRIRTSGAATWSARRTSRRRGTTSCAASPAGSRSRSTPLGRRVRVLEEVPDVPGDTLVLTLDRDLQEAAERALGDRSGAVVALDPRNGEVLALASRPAYDPNLFARGIQRGEWRALVQDPLKPLNDRAVQGQYPPGSTFKVVMAAAGLEEGADRTEDRRLLPRRHAVRQPLLRLLATRRARARSRLHQAIVQSCDVFFYQLGQRLGIDTHRGVVAQFRPRRCRPASASSTRRRASSPTRSGSCAASSGRGWRARRMSVSIGQGYVTTTPLQMAQVVATIANGGTRLPPALREARRRARRHAATGGRARGRSATRRSSRPSTAQKLRAAMRDVVMTAGRDRAQGAHPRASRSPARRARRRPSR